MQAIKNFFTVTLPNMGLSLLPKLVFAALILIVGFRIVNMILKRMKEKEQPNRRLVQSFLRILIAISLKTLLILTAASTVGIPITSLVTVLASAGVAVALALQDSLSNIASGVFLAINDAYDIGDYVETNGVSGTVQEVKLFQTILVTPDHRRVVLPNSSIASSTLINYSSEENRRVDFVVGVSYNSKIDHIKSLLIAIAQNHPLVLSDPEPMARLAEFGDSSMDFTFRVWCRSEDYWTVKFDINEQIKRVFDQSNVEIPFPQLDLNINSIKKQ